MNLSEYPHEIAAVRRHLLKLEQQIRTARESVKFALNHIEHTVAFDSSLKNENQRKAKKTELMEQDADYIKAQNKLQGLLDKQALLEIDLELMRSEFSVAKLQTREQIADMEAAA